MPPRFFPHEGRKSSARIDLAAAAHQDEVGYCDQNRNCNSKRKQCVSRCWGIWKTARNFAAIQESLIAPKMERFQASSLKII